MTTAAVLVWHPLPGNATFARRGWAWVPGGDGTDDRDGTLLIRQARGKVGAWRADEYGVEEGDRVGGDRPGRVFTLEGPPRTPDAYEVFVADAGPDLDCCTCTAGQCKLAACKHRAALRELFGA